MENFLTCFSSSTLHSHFHQNKPVLLLFGFFHPVVDLLSFSLIFRVLSELLCFSFLSSYSESFSDEEHLDVKYFFWEREARAETAFAPHPLCAAVVPAAGGVGLVRAALHLVFQGVLLVQGGVAHVLVDGVDGHLSDVLRGLKKRRTDVRVTVKVTVTRRSGRTNPEWHLSLDVERDEAVCHQVVDGLEPLLAHKMLPIVIQPEVSGLIPKPGKINRIIYHSFNRSPIN